MGIPRLTQDILPYGRSIVLGSRVWASGTDYIDKVVIDGPSLVYHVYYLLLKQYRATKSSGKPSNRPRDVLIAYSVVAEAVITFLELLQNSGVTVNRIFFDGGLPLKKQPVRLERLQKARQQLEHYRLLNSSSPFQGIQSVSDNLGGLREDLWQTTSVMDPSSRLPLPPFLVPGVIEQLRMSTQWHGLAQVVPGESDSYCAQLAAGTGAAVLSNDSDLIVYNLGEHGCVVKLDAVQYTQSATTPIILRASCFRSAEVARGVGAPDLRLYAYQRSIDGQSSARIIAQRARAFDPVTVGKRSEYGIFLQDFASPPSVEYTDSRYLRHLSVLDPRTAELVCSLDAQEALAIYLPVLFEDSSRDSSWSYGTNVRQIAYSILLNSHKSKANSSSLPPITEYSRRGRAIKDSLVGVLSPTQTVKHIDDLLQRLHSDICPESVGAQKLLAYYSWAARIVHESKVQNAKSCIVQIYRLLLDDKNAFSPTWDDIHIFANMQAVLYSLRMVRQICEYVRLCYPSCEILSGREVMMLDSLADMPSIEGLFHDIIQLRESFCNLPLAERALRYHSIELAANSVHMHDKQTATGTSTPDPKTIHEILNGHPMTKQGTKDSSVYDNTSLTSPRKSNRTPIKSKTNNPFALLLDESYGLDANSSK